MRSLWMLPLLAGQLHLSYVRGLLLMTPQYLLQRHHYISTFFTSRRRNYRDQETCGKFSSLHFTVHNIKMKKIQGDVQRTLASGLACEGMFEAKGEKLCLEDKGPMYNISISMKYWWEGFVMIFSCIIHEIGRPANITAMAMCSNSL